MVRGLRPLTVVATLTLVACGPSNAVHSTRADPISGTVVPSSEPTDTTRTTDAPNATDNTGSSTAATPASLEWGRCDDPSADDPSLQCATLAVPLDYDNPAGGSIDLALVKVPASGDRKGAALLNPGGPGGSGFDFVAGSGSIIASTLGLESLDLIGFDPRGVDRSGGIHCVSDEFEDKHLYVDDTPDTPQEKALKDEADAGFVDGCIKKYGDTLRFYSTENTARDMDAIRAALGDPQISFLGASYGTYLGATYATMFPDRVRALVLDSAFEPNGDTVEQQFETDLVGFEGAFNNWVAWCQGDTTCDFTAADVGARWDALKEKLDATPVAGPDGRLANNSTMETATTEALYSRDDWPVLAKALADAERGDTAGIFALADAYNQREPNGTFHTLAQSFRVIECASGIDRAVPDDPAALLATLRAAAPRFAKDMTVQDLTSGAADCTKMVGDTKPVQLSYSGDGPIVVVGGTNDPATPIRWAQKMTGELGKNARLVTFTGEGHGQLVVSNCVSQIEGALLEKLTLPKSGTVCNPNPVVAKPKWWDALPVPDGISAVTSLPALAEAIGVTPTEVFSEMRTTTLSAVDAVAAYTSALSGSGFDQFDVPNSLPIADTARGVYGDGNDNRLVVVAFGPKAFDANGFESAKTEAPVGTTVVVVFAQPN